MARSTGRSAALVGAGILLSRITGLVRQRVFSHFLGLTDAADALSAAFRIPNLLQNLFGEGVLSASFIPVYARLLGQGREEDAGKVAGAMAGLLGFVVALLVLAGVAATPLLVDLLAPGFTGEKRVLTIDLVRILFPATGLLVLSAWCLGVLNSHGRFFLSYAAPVVWNVTIIATTIVAGSREGQTDLVVVIAWGAVAGSFLQLLAQLPSVLALVRSLRLSTDTTNPEVRTVLGNFGPALMGRGVNQISSYVDGVIASLLGTGAAAAVMNAQLLYTLPVSMFGMSVSAAELPAMSAAPGSDVERNAMLRSRLELGIHRLAYFIVPCAVAFLALGEVVSGAVFQTGQFTGADSRYVWVILAGSTVGLLASTMSRLSSSTFYALGDTRTPLRYAVVRVVLTTVLGFLCAVPLPRLLGVELRWGAVGLTATAGLSGWIEFLLLRRRLEERIGVARFEPWYLAKLWLAALVAAGVGWAILGGFGPLGPLSAAVAVLVPYSATYGVVTLVFRIPTARALLVRGRLRA
ncbi:MAG: murein biosynthesis integral membrane protein MurJ [Gemmatimonadetes bacterium]|nr:murein biosynthesis integral membrane protein MurJ [Gemmatimonadota bacterium]